MASPKGTWPAGYRIDPRTPGPPSEVLEAFRSASVALVGDCTGGNAGAVGLSAYHGKVPTVMCGPALTVRVRPGDNLLVHKALSMAEPGDVIVIDGGGLAAPALIGGLMRALAIGRHIAGFVVDGAIRDVSEWVEGGIAVFARGHSHLGPSKEGPGEINVSIKCASLIVNPGDIVIGDADGVICVPVSEIESLLSKISARIANEREARKRNLGGKGPEWVDEILRAKGVPT